MQSCDEEDKKDDQVYFSFSPFTLQLTVSFRFSVNIFSRYLISSVSTESGLNLPRRVLCIPQSHQKYRDIILSDNSHNSLLSFAPQQAARLWPLFQSAVSRGPRMLVKCIAFSVMFLLAIFKEGAGSIFPRDI